MSSPRPNSLRAWLLAARPKTLSGAAVPVVVATAVAVRDGVVALLPAVLCLLFAWLMQIAANLINDLIDYTKGSDRGDRLGPARACASGWISPGEMKRGIVVTLLLAVAVGLGLLRFGNTWVLLGIGGACIVFAFLYTTLFSYMGLGDVLVVVFFGLVPVCGTYYVETGSLTGDAWAAAVACGLVIDTLLVVNNYRDYETDLRYGKHTLITHIGLRRGRGLYLALGVASFALAAVVVGLNLWLILPMLYLPLHYRAWQMMGRLRGRELNRVLGINSRNMLYFAVLLGIAIVLSR